MTAPQADPWGNVPATNGTLGGYAQNLGNYFGNIFSDENLKTDVSDGGSDIDEMLGKLAAKTYRYKDEAKHGEGKRAGILAQDLQKSPMGAAVVIHTPDGLALDPGKAISAALAATARLHERMSNLEGKRG